MRKNTVAVSAPMDREIIYWGDAQKIHDTDLAPGTMTEWLDARARRVSRSGQVGRYYIAPVDTDDGLKELNILVAYTPLVLGEDMNVVDARAAFEIVHITSPTDGLHIPEDLEMALEERRFRHVPGDVLLRDTIREVWRRMPADLYAHAVNRP